MRAGRSAVPDEFAIPCAAEKTCIDERGEYGLALNGVELPQSLNLGGRQAQTGTFEELRANMTRDRTDCHRGGAHRRHDVTMKRPKPNQNAKHKPDDVRVNSFLFQAIVDGF